MLFTNGRISARQMQALVILWIFSSALVGMPSAAVFNVYSVILGAVIVVAESWLICFVESKMKPAVQKLSAWLAGISMIVYSGINLRLVCGAVSLYLLPNTPQWIVAAVFVLAAIYMAVLGIQTVGRAGELLFVIVAVNAVIAAILCFADASGGLLSSAFGGADENVIAGGIKCACMFGGVQALYVLLPYTDGENTAEKAVCAVVIAVAAAVLFTYTAVSKFGLADTAVRTYPALNIMDTVSFEYIFGDKQDVFMLRLWIFAAFGAVGLGIFSCGAVFGGKGWYMVLSGLTALAVFAFAENINGTLRLLYLAGGVSLVLFGIILPLIAIFLRMGGEKK
ncbi:MAG: spore germination protein [Clostridiales bacterium]|nr:spore germination protein [Clostridiales bacterium]